MKKNYMVTTTGDRYIINAFSIESALHNYNRDRPGHDNDEIIAIVLYEEPKENVEINTA